MIWMAWLFLALAENPGDAELALTLHNQGTVERQLGQYPEAERHLRRAIAIWEQHHPSHRPELASSLQNLATLYLTLGRLSQAEPLYRRAYDLRRTTLGEQHPLTAISLHCLAELFHARHRYAEAEDLFTRAAALLDPNSLEFADLSHNRAMLYHDLHRDPEAKALLEGAAAVYEKSSPSHPKFAVILRNLADLDAARAAGLYARSLAICNAALPPDHPQTGIILQAYARYLKSVGRKNESRLTEQRANAILAKSGRANGTALTVDASAFARP